ncbi:MAG TPA: hypothetical protein VFI37_13180 [Gaiellaceae bacterium]|jgi:hypothetical protein|nr:hypothetical protein [Gaiellaceae bacterium]
MPEEARETASEAGTSPQELDVAAVFERLKQEVRGTTPRLGEDPARTQVRLSVRDQAERLWPISAERPLVGKGGPVKAVLRRLMRWYVEPMAADQRAFNDAALKLIDDLSERVDRLTEAVSELERR